MNYSIVIHCPVAVDYALALNYFGDVTSMFEVFAAIVERYQLRSFPSIILQKKPEQLRTSQYSRLTFDAVLVDHL